MKNKVLLIIATVMLGACGGTARLPEEASMGPSPRLGEPEHRLLPTVNIADIDRWPQGKQPQPAPGCRVTATAKDRTHPRSLYVLPNGDAPVAETNKPQRPPAPPKITGRAVRLLESNST